MNRQILLLNYHSAMLAELGPSHWWPGEGAFEIALGTILTQNTAWTNVEKAMRNLREAGVLTASAMYHLSDAQMSELIRPAGSFRVKTARVRNFLRFLRETCDLDMMALPRGNMNKLRSQLLQVSGIGPETADSILLYALNQPSFVVDAYTRRIFNRHMLVPEDVGYEELRAFFMDVLPAEVRLFNEFHALIVRTGKMWCAKKAGKCAACPLSKFLNGQPS